MVERPTMRRRGRRGIRRAVIYIVASIVLIALVVFLFCESQNTLSKPIILYVNQGNGVVGESNFGTMLSFASSHGFNTLFFQVYREGSLLFSSNDLRSFVNQSHAEGLKIFFALYFTNSSQPMPNTIFGLGEDGISLDVSTLSLSTQEGLLADLAPCHCQTAVTTTDMSSPLKPDLLVLETYGPALQQYIRPGIIASVGVFATSSLADYQSQFQYALSNSGGVMVFDYAGLLKSGY
ncbi:MAG TPA: hypothetical protein VEJ19_04130 [Nitrososphaerales archaeon]|nr:hypothetical protein [Nitrososphaerales archaeon]